jgi:hypothetical protein
LQEVPISVSHFFPFPSFLFRELMLAPRSFTAEFEARVDANKIALDQLRKVVTKHLEKNGRRWVSMNSLFSFMKV